MSTTLRPIENNQVVKSAGVPISESTWSALAALRFFLATVVVFGHLTMMCNYSPLLILGKFSGIGAVAAFLLISGFSIAHSYEQKSKGFFSRRFDRIVPVYVACFILACVPYAIWGNGFAFGGDPPKFVQFIGDFFLLNGLFVKSLPTLDPAWSLAVEVLCYALTPFFARLSSKHLLWLIGASASIFVVHAQFSDGGFIGDMCGLSFLLTAWIWLVGFLFYRHRADRLAGPLLIVGTSCILTLGSTTITPIPTAVVTLTAALMYWRPGIYGRWAKVGNWAGDCSYPLYLIHWPIMSLAFGLNITNSALIMLASFTGAAVVLYGVDYPFRAYRRRQKKMLPV